jgi:hypothetical protein
VETLAMICSALDMNGGSVAGGTSSILVLGGLSVSCEFFRRRLLRRGFDSISTDSRLTGFCFTQLSALSLFFDAADFSLVEGECELTCDRSEDVLREACSLELVKLRVRGAL